MKNPCQACNQLEIKKSHWDQHSLHWQVQESPFHTYWTGHHLFAPGASWWVSFWVSQQVQAVYW
jgi:hypothetical protein